MTMGTATVTSTKVRTTGERPRSQLPSNRFRTVKVGKTASQIMTASWCLGGGPTGRALLLTLDMVLPGLVGVGGQRVGKLGGSKVARHWSPLVGQTWAPRWKFATAWCTSSSTRTAFMAMA